VRYLDFVICENMSKRLNTIVSDFVGTEVDFGQCLYVKMKAYTRGIKSDEDLPCCVRKLQLGIEFPGR
jgi:hypothetical protein